MMRLFILSTQIFKFAGILSSLAVRIGYIYAYKGVEEYMLRIAVDGFPEDEWSREEEIARENEFVDTERRARLAPSIGRGPLYQAVFDLNQEIGAPLPIGRDPYNRLSHLNLN